MLESLFENTLLFLFLAILLGLYLGSVKILGVSLGAAAIFFVALPFGHYGVTVPRIVMELGLALFVYAICIKIGPKFVRDFRRSGLQLVGMAFVMLGAPAIVTFAIAYARGLSPDIAAGLYSGALMNTPALIAAVGILEKYHWGAGAAAIAGYGVTYLFALLCAVAYVQLLPRFQKRSVEAEEAAWDAEQKHLHPGLDFRQFRVENPICIGKTIAELNGLFMHRDDSHSLNISRVARLRPVSSMGQPCYVSHPATDSFVIAKDDVIRVVGKERDLGRLSLVFGPEVPLADIQTGDDETTSADVVVTTPSFANKPLDELPVAQHKVKVVRITRDENAISPNGRTIVKIGNTIRVVGYPSDVLEFVRAASEKNPRFDKTDMITFVVGLVIGFFIGGVPIPIPGGSPIALGPAGGALVAGIFVSSRKRLLGRDIYIPAAALGVIEELGLLVFMAGAGLTAGGRFMSIASTLGPELFVEGAIITLSALIAGTAYMWYMGANVVATMAALSAGMTQPAALEATRRMANKSDLAVLSFAVVYPFAMGIKILSSQILVLVLHLVR